MAEILDDRPGLLSRGGFFTSAEQVRKGAELRVRAGVARHVLGAFSRLESAGIPIILEYGHDQVIDAHSGSVAETAEAVRAKIKATRGQWRPRAFVAMAGSERFTVSSLADTAISSVKVGARSLILGAGSLAGTYKDERRAVLVDSTKELIKHGLEYTGDSLDVPRPIDDNHGSSLLSAYRLAAEWGVRVVRVVPTEDMFFRGAQGLELPGNDPNFINLEVPGGHDVVQYSPVVAGMIANAVNS